MAAGQSDLLTSVTSPPIPMVELASSLGIDGRCSGAVAEQMVLLLGSELEITKHSVHNIRGGDLASPSCIEYQLSNLKKFDLEVMLAAFGLPEQAVERQVELQVRLMYESRAMVGPDPTGAPLLIGSTSAKTVGGRHCFRLQLGPHVLSRKHQGNLFRLQVAPADPDLAACCPLLTKVSEPLRALTKVAAPACAQAGQAGRQRTSRLYGVLPLRATVTRASADALGPTSLHETLERERGIGRWEDGKILHGRWEDVPSSGTSSRRKMGKPRHLPMASLPLSRTSSGVWHTMYGRRQAEYMMAEDKLARENAAMLQELEVLRTQGGSVGSFF